MLIQIGKCKFLSKRKYIIICIYIYIMKITINNSPVPNITKSSSTKNDIRSVSSILMDNFTNGTLHEFLHSQKYTKKEMHLLCKAANIEHTGMSVDDMIDALVTKMYSEEKTILEKLHLMFASGDLVIRGGIAISAATVLVGAKFRQLQSMLNATQKIDKDENKKNLSFINIIIGVVLVAIVSSFSLMTSQSEKDYSKSTTDLSKSYKNYNKIVQQQRRKRTSNILKLGVVANSIKKTRLHSRKKKVLRDIKKGNSVVSKMKRLIFGGFTPDQLQEQYNDINAQLKNV